MTRTTPELAPPPNFRTTPTGGRLELSHDLTCNRHHIQGGSSVKSGCEPGAPRPQSCDLTTAEDKRRPIQGKAEESDKKVETGGVSRWVPSTIPDKRGGHLRLLSGRGGRSDSLISR
ncbi:hypothetical protein AVEN_169189-1 [Araneus ventricosus]|uniref:Uncharacterized protein n=1 Tax=Araneus ventricosus TaxID=182803 RepID=A0A4Y2V598_ARAVE|nr:hypothetical protein AVEN_247812-1 [Araneus ventricosus]GBO19236.1 hypothetical protein AVEN_169189-1 [Araneus ventricosus]